MIDTQETLAKFLAALRSAEWVAIDTEADSLHSYPEKLCLIQFSIPGEDALVDPLAGLDCRPVFETLSKREILIHAGDYDLRLLYRTYGFRPASIFDTMLAARLAGHREFGLQRLVQHYLDIPLEKGPQKADWSRRPLTERMMTYARNDARYLKPLADRLRARLIELGRLDWLGEWCDWQIRECATPRQADPELVWRLSGSDRLEPRALAFLRELWWWREAEARRTCRPPYFVLSHERVVALAGSAARGEPWQPHLPPKLSENRRRGIARTIERAAALPAGNWPRLVRKLSPRWGNEARRRYDALEHRRNVSARELGLEPSLIASRATLGALAEDWERNAPQLMNWQKKLLAG